MSDPTASELIRLHSDWSEDRFCASFLTPEPDFVKEFIEDLPDLLAKEMTAPRESYELEFLAEYERQTGRHPA